jgi:hypothetical protein
MTISDLGNLGELIGGVLVLVSVGYLALQVRQNTTVQRATAKQAIASQTSEFSVTLLSRPELHDVFWEGLKNPDVLDKRQRRDFALLMHLILRNLEEVHYQHSLGVLEYQFWEAEERELEYMLEFWPGFRWFLDNRTAFLSVPFQEYVDGKASAIKLRPISEEQMGV